MVKIDREAIDEFVRTAYESGAPRDQVENFLTRGYVPIRWQWKFHAEARKCDEPDGATELGAGGARGPGKSHCVFSQVTLDDCQRKDGLKILFLRQTGKAARESFEDLILRVLAGKVDYDYNKSSGFLSFANTSRVLLGGFESEGDIDKYIGIEYDGIAIEELNQLTKNKVDKLLGSMRTSRTDWRPRLYTSFNPGGIGHQFVKKKFIIPYREGTETKTRFVPSTYKDNPYLNKEYIDYLEGLEGNLGKAWREGEFDLFEGQFFIEFSQQKHVVQPFAIPESWLKFRSIDPSGRDGITSCHWYALDWNRRVFCYREHYGTGLDADQHATEITRLSEGEKYRYTVIDSSAFSKLGLPETMAEIYERCGVIGLTPSSKQRVVGWNTVHTYLRWDKNTDPQLKIFSTCKDIIRTLPELVHDDLHPEDLNCFIAGTKVSTINGEKNIENIKIGELVETPIGYRQVIWAGLSGKSPLITVKLSNGKELCGTPNHKIFIKNKGLVELRELEIGGIIQEKIDVSKLWQLKKLFITGLHIGKNITHLILVLIENILNWVIHNYIVKSTLTILERFQKETIFTIKTIIQTIIPQKILLRCRDMNIVFTTDILPVQRLKRTDISGKNQKGGIKHYEKTHKKCETIPQNEGYRAEIVELLLQQRTLLELYVKIVKSIKDTLKKFVPFVGKSLCILEGRARKPVHIVAVGNLEKETPVYNLTVEEAHLYYANGMLATNTKGEDHAADELRYFLQTLREGHTPRPLTFVEQRLKEMKEKEENFNLNYSKSNNFLKR